MIRQALLTKEDIRKFIFDAISEYGTNQILNRADFCNYFHISFYQLDKYLDMGYALGRLNLKSVYITDGTVTKKISPMELEHYISKGWHQGKDNAASANIAKSRVQYTYTYDSHRFDSCKDILVYLKDNGYPCISLSSVINIAEGGFVEKYTDLCGKITRVHV